METFTYRCLVVFHVTCATCLTLRRVIEEPEKGRCSWPDFSNLNCSVQHPYSVHRLSSHRQLRKHGLSVVKSQKTGSSTLAHIVKDWQSFSDHRWSLWNAEEPLYQSNLTDSFNLTMVRHPLTRVISHYYQCRKPDSGCKEQAENGFQDFYQFGKKASNLQTRFLLPESKLENAFESPYWIDHPKKLAYKLLQAYNLVLITEKFDEGLVMLHLLLGVPVQALLYQYKKFRGGPGEERRETEHITFDENTTCTMIQRNRFDIALYELARERYTLTAAALGSDLTKATHAYSDLIAKFEKACDRVNLPESTFEACRYNFCETERRCSGSLLED